MPVSLHVISGLGELADVLNTQWFVGSENGRYYVIP